MTLFSRSDTRHSSSLRSSPPRSADTPEFCRVNPNELEVSVLGRLPRLALPSRTWLYADEVATSLPFNDQVVLLDRMTLDGPRANLRLWEVPYSVLLANIRLGGFAVPAAAMLLRDATSGAVLLGRRSHDTHVDGGLWDLPGETITIADVTDHTGWVSRFVSRWVSEELGPIPFKLQNVWVADRVHGPWWLLVFEVFVNADTVLRSWMSGPDGWETTEWCEVSSASQIPAQAASRVAAVLPLAFEPERVTAT